MTILGTMLLLQEGYEGGRNATLSRTPSMSQPPEQWQGATSRVVQRPDDASALLRVVARDRRPRPQRCLSWRGTLVGGPALLQVSVQSCGVGFCFRTMAPSTRRARRATTESSARALASSSFFRSSPARWLASRQYHLNSRL